jgi:hypothetical protein
VQSTIFTIKKGYLCKILLILNTWLFKLQNLLNAFKMWTLIWYQFHDNQILHLTQFSIINMIFTWYKYSKFNHCLKYSHDFWLVWTIYELGGNTIVHVMKIEMWCLIIVLHWYCGVHTWTFNESHLHIGHIIFWNMLWNVNHKALLNWMMLVQEVWDWLMQPLCNFNWFQQQ